LRMMYLQKSEHGEKPSLQTLFCLDKSFNAMAAHFVHKPYVILCNRL
jgi:hypothetical protein